MKHFAHGWFVFRASADGQSSCCMVEGYDGEPIILTGFNQFHGCPVRITVELGLTDYIHHTGSATRTERNAERVVLCS